LVNKFPRRQILGKQSIARLRNNSKRLIVFNVVRAMPSAVYTSTIIGVFYGSVPKVYRGE
jgi:hypothetical protein